MSAPQITVGRHELVQIHRISLMWAIFRLHQFPLSNIKKTYQAFPGILEIYLHQHKGYYGIREQSVISRHRIVVSRPLGGRGSCALAAAFAAAFAASFTTWFETGQTCDYCDCTIQSFSPREYITTGSYWVAMGYNHSTLTSENDHCCSPTVES